MAGLTKGNEKDHEMAIEVRKVEAWDDGRGQRHKTEQEARRAAAKGKVEDLIRDAVSGCDYEIDMNMVIANIDELLEATQTYVECERFLR